MKTISTFRGEYGFLSNFHGNNNDTVEHKYQAAKAKHVSDYIKLLACPTPTEAKQMGKIIEPRDNWNQIKLVIMEELLREKFSKSPYKALLIATENALLIEGNSWGDTFWGVCNGEGENHLGKILMKIRDEFLSLENILEY